MAQSAGLCVLCQIRDLYNLALLCVDLQPTVAQKVGLALAHFIISLLLFLSALACDLLPLFYREMLQHGVEVG